MWEVSIPMNKNQKIVMIVMAVLFFLMLIFPPFLFNRGSGVTVNLGYGFILNPPHLGGGYRGTDGLINLSLLKFQYLIVITIGAILWCFFKNEKK